MSKKSRASESNSTAALQVVLADVYVLMLKTHGFHWNVESQNFTQLHTMFEEQYKALFESADELAERIRALDVTAPSSFAQFSKLTNIKEETKAPSADAMIAQLIADREILDKDIKEALEVADDADDEATEDVLIQLLRANDKQTWMLRATSRK